MVIYYFYNLKDLTDLNSYICFLHSNQWLMNLDARHFVICKESTQSASFLSIRKSPARSINHEQGTTMPQVSKMLPNILEMLLNSSCLTTPELLNSSCLTITELLFCNSPIPEKNIKPNLLIDCLFFIFPSLTDSGFSALFPPHSNPGGIKLSFMWAMQIQFNSLQLIKTICSHPDRANKSVFVVWTWILILLSPLCSFPNLNVGIFSLKAP